MTYIWVGGECVRFEWDGFERSVEVGYAVLSEKTDKLEPTNRIFARGWREDRTGNRRVMSNAEKL